MRDRKTNFEILRIIAMFLIVLGHSMTHGTLLNSDHSKLTFFLFRFLAYSGKIGVYLFILITGYFMIYSETSIKKIVKIWLPVFFWSVLLTATVGYMINNLSYRDIIMSLFPIFTNRYWFISTYMFLYLLIPIINKLILSLSKREEFFALIFGITMILPIDYLYGHNIDSWLLTFCFIYSIGAIVRKRNLLKDEFYKILSRWLIIIGFIANTLMSFVIANFKNSVGLIGKLSLVFEKETIFCAIIALGLFIWLGSKNIKNSNVINVVSSTTFGIYLIHDNSKMQSLIWTKIFTMDRLNFSSFNALIYILFSTVIVFLASSILELVRKKIFDKIETNISKYVSEFISSIMQRISIFS